VKPAKIESILRRLNHTVASAGENPVVVPLLLAADAIKFLQGEVCNLRAELGMWQELHPFAASAAPSESSR